MDVSTANIDSLKAMPDVDFDFAVSSAVKRAFRAEATTVSGQRGSRATWRTTGLTDFRGHFSDVFRQNGRTQLTDLDEVVSTLRQVATEIEKVEQAAREENQRRATARAWAERQANRNGFEKWIQEHITGEEDPPAVTLSDSGPRASVPQPSRGSRQTPAPGSGGGAGGGTSSARPADLRSFATSSKGGDEQLSGSAGRLERQCDDFVVSCGWAKLDASGPIQGLREWLRLNAEDAAWAITVADAFAKAGGEGNVSSLSNQTIEAALRANHISASRRDIQIDPPTAYGSPPTTGYANDPVNTSTGNFTETECDLTFTGPATALQLIRSYNSMNATIGAFGTGWNSWTESGLQVDAEAARLRLPDGREVVFPRLGAGWDRAVGENLWLTRADTREAGFRVTNSSGLRWELRADGRPARIGTGPGTVVEFDYDSTGRLTTLTHEFGRRISLQWDDESSRVVGVSADDGRQVRYDYDDASRLVAATGPQRHRHYRWNEADLIEAVIDADGVVEAENTYDEYARVISQRSPFGRTTRFVYLPGGVTEVSDADETRANTWIADGRGRLIGVIDADGHRQSTSYDRYGNPVLVTQRDGATLSMFYDERGRRIRQVTPTGADLAWSYDELDRVVEVTVTNTDGTDAVTRYDYEGPGRNPTQVTDPEGGITRLHWDRGLLQEVVDPEGVTVRFEYDRRGDLVATTDADGNVARLERDALGRVTAAITPLGHRTTFRYDGTGPLLSRQDPEGGMWRFEHTAGGRLTAVTDPTGGRTTIEHGSHGEQQRTIDPLGRAVGSTYDDLGNRAQVELPDGTTWTFAHDAMSRLVGVTDAAGGSWRLDYDVDGRLARTSDATGVLRSIERDPAGRPVQAGDLLSRTTAEYDALGRTVVETGPDGAPTSNRYDRCGRLIEHIDATGGVTRIERDRAGRPVHITHPMGSTFHYDYDACGRRSAIIDTDGSRYQLGYDADGRVVSELWPTGEQVHTRYDAAGRLAERSEPGKGTSRFGYDAAGRLTWSSDAWYGRRRFRYDAAGQLVEVVNALGGVSRFDYDPTGRCVATVDPLGARTERSFDPMGRVLTETDPLGRTTRYSYDAAGRQTRRVDPTGATLSWTYDATGRLRDTIADGTVLSSVERDLAERTMRVREGETVHELVWDAAGQLVRRSRGGVGLSWAYDGDGRRTSFTGIHGEQTRYEYDAAGRVAAVQAPGLGRAVIERDAIGRIVSMAAPGLYASWTWRGGAVIGLEVSREGVTQRTEIERDDAGRVLAETTDGVRTAYGYDAAGQLIEARRSDGSVTSYAYDASGRLVRENADGVVTTYDYDAAGQLLARRDRDGRTEFGYDAAGRRVREAGPAGERRFAWDPRGFLSSITTISHVGDSVSARTQRLTVDALGELADVDDAPVLWDSAAAVPTLARVGDVSLAGFGPLTGVLPDGPSQAHWLAPDWRPRPGGTDPWDVPAEAAPPGLPAGVMLGGQGGLLVDGLEWLQARVYDPAARGFLSTDPLPPVPGAGWAGNPYSFAGNDPLNASDPWGLRPVTDAELQAYRDSNNGSLRNAASAATNWVKDNWEYIAAGALIVGGVLVMATGVGGPIGAAMIGGALLSAGASAGMQKAQNGSVDWGRVAVDGAIGGVAGLAGGGAGVAVARAGMRTGLNCFGRNMLTGAAAGMADGGVSGGLSYATSGQPLTVAGFAQATGGGMLAGGVTGGAAGGVFTKVTGSACFVAGTQVLLGDGSSKPIEEIVVGDEVLAADPTTGETYAKPVVDTYVHDEVETYVVETSAGAVTSTAEHPFYVEGKGWVPVRSLVSGDLLVDPEGIAAKVIEVVPTGETATVYNLHVEDLHNYHVGVGEHWIRVHNSCDVSPDFIVKPNGETVIVPKGAEGPFPVESGKGFIFRGGSGGHGLSEAASDVRIMDPVIGGKYPKPDGYASYLNSGGQTINPYTGQTVGKSDPWWHWEFQP